MMANEKCDSCKLRYVCEEQAAFICKQRNYCDYMPDSKILQGTNKKRLIDAMDTVTKISKRVTQQIAQGCHPQRVYAEVLNCIAEAPTVDAVEVVHGRWVLKSRIYKMLDDVDEEFYVECNLCNREEPVCFEFGEQRMLEYAKQHYPYCHCGAKMDGDGNG